MEFDSGDAEMEGIIAKTGTALDLQVSTTSLSYPSNRNTFQFSIAIMPAQTQVQQVVQVATSVTAKLVKQWGVPVA